MMTATKERIPMVGTGQTNRLENLSFYALAHQVAYFKKLCTDPSSM